MATRDDPVEPVILEHLPAGVPVFRCSGCYAEVALQDELVSRSFSGAQGREAFLVRSTINTVTGPREHKQLLTGAHTIATVRCAGCKAALGWTYFAVPDASQDYKLSKSVLEIGPVVKDNKWELPD